VLVNGSLRLEFPVAAASTNIKHAFFNNAFGPVLEARIRIVTIQFDVFGNFLEVSLRPIWGDTGIVAALRVLLPPKMHCEDLGGWELA
jgi:hypothetical protein